MAFSLREIVKSKVFKIHIQFVLKYFKSFEREIDFILILKEVFHCLTHKSVGAALYSHPSLAVFLVNRGQQTLL